VCRGHERAARVQTVYRPSVVLSVLVTIIDGPCQRARKRRGEVGWRVPARELAGIGVGVMVGETNPKAFLILEH